MTTVGSEGPLYLETINPLDMTHEDLESIARAVTAVTNVPVEVAYEDQHGAGVTWHEVLYVWLPSADFAKDAIWDRVLDVVVDKMRDRFRRRGNDRRPKSVLVREQGTGRVVQGWLIASVDSEVVADPQPDMSPRRMPPPRKSRRSR